MGHTIASGIDPSSSLRTFGVPFLSFLRSTQAGNHHHGRRLFRNPRLAAAMAGEDAAAVSGRSAAPRNQPKKEEVDEDEDDYLPISHSRAKKGNETQKSNVNSKAKASKFKKEESESDDDFMGNKKQKSSVNSKAKASKLKKEESESDDDFMLNAQKRSVAMSNHKTSKIKKIKDEDFDTKDQKKIKKEGVKEGEKKAAEVKVKKMRKAYELPGQKHDPPPERDPLRIFYESLYEQIPSSEMAATWLMEWGLLPSDVAAEVLRRKGQKLKSPVKPTPVKRITSSPNKKAPVSSAKKINSAGKDAGKTTSQKKRKAISDTDDDDDDDYDDDVVISKTKTKRQKMISS